MPKSFCANSQIRLNCASFFWVFIASTDFLCRLGAEVLEECNKLLVVVSNRQIQSSRQSCLVVVHTWGRGGKKNSCRLDESSPMKTVHECIYPVVKKLRAIYQWKMVMAHGLLCKHLLQGKCVGPPFEETRVPGILDIAGLTPVENE